MYKQALFFKYISVLLIIFIAFTSCKKGKSTITLKGNIFNASSNNFLSNFDLELYEIEISTGLEKLIGSVSTDNNGEFSFEFPRNQVDHYVLRGVKEGYFNVEESIPFSELSIKKENYVYTLTYAKAWVKLRFENQDPQPGETLQYNVNKVKTGCEECCSTGQKTISGVIDTTIYCINNGNQTFEYYYNNNLTGESGFKSAITTSFDTTEIHLIY